MPESIRIVSTEKACGSISLKNDGPLKVRIRLTLSKPLSDTDVLKIRIFSSVNKHKAPFYCGIAETKGTDCVFCKAFDNVTDCGDMDGVDIFIKNVFTDEITPFLTISFPSDPDSPHASPICKAPEAPFEECISPVTRAADILDSFRASRSFGENTGICNLYMKNMLRIADTGEPVCTSLPHSFIWHRLTDICPLMMSSALEHILSYPETALCIQYEGYILLGTNEAESKVCISVPVCEAPVQPMKNVDDCVVYIKDDFSGNTFCCVCVHFAEDGQYFMPIY